MNITMILSGGIGSRFNAITPKQYCLLNGRPIIEYAIDACRLSRLSNNTIIVATGKYIDELHQKYGYETVAGGKERNNSVKNGLDYIAAHYDCEKVVMIDAVSPLTTEDQIDKYFELLDTYDIVQTAQKMTTSLDKYDGEKVQRNDFYQTLEPEAYNFKMLYEHFDGDNPSTTVYHQMPQESKKYACFDYPYNMKITYPFDIGIASLLLEDCILKPKRERVLNRTKKWLGSIDNKATAAWLENLSSQLEDLCKKWEISTYHINPQSFTGVVIEGYSKIYGNVVVKFDAPILGRYKGECFYYLNAGKSFMANMIDFDDEYNVMLLKQVFPGRQVSFDQENTRLRSFYDSVNDSFVACKASENPELKTVIGNFWEYVRMAEPHGFERQLRKKLESVAARMWDRYFAKSEEVLLHMDLHRRNILDSGDMYKAIDCQGVIGPKEFEFTRMQIIDNKDSRADTVTIVKSMFDFCLKYVSKERLNAASFIEWVFLMDEFVFADNDNYNAAAWAIQSIKELFYRNIDLSLDELPDPQMIN